MFVYKVSLCFVLMLSFVRKIDGDDQHGSGSFSGIAFEMLLTKLDLMQEHLFETDQKLVGLSKTIDHKHIILQTETKAVMKEFRDQIERKLSQLEDKMDHKLTALQTQSNVFMKEHRQSIDLKLSQQENLSKGLMRAIDQLGHNFTELQAQSSTIVQKGREYIEQKLVGVTESMKKLKQSLNTLKLQSNVMLNQYKESTDGKLNQLIQSVDDKFKALQALSNKTEESVKESAIWPDPSSFSSCKTHSSEQSGKYFIMSNKHDTPFEVYCEQSVHGGGWIVFQHRFNGSVNFYRNWEAYRNGFGSLDGEFWLGLEHLHQLTSARRYELLVELKDYSGVYKYARFDDIEIGSEAEKYVLKKLGSFSGTAGATLNYNNGMKFTTKDQDNDVAYLNCAVHHKGAWWYNSCTHSNLNGIYKNDTGKEYMYWFRFKASYESLAYTRMSIREI